jgi:solute carrier family 50 (sugar transporter)
MKRVHYSRSLPQHQVIFGHIFFDYTTTIQHNYLLLSIAAFTFGTLSYVQYEDKDLVLHRFGIINTIVLIMLISAPLFSLGEIIRNKSTEGLPFAIILSGTVVAASWLVYGIILRDNFIVVSYILRNLVSGFIIYIFIFRSKMSSVLV